MRCDALTKIEENEGNQADELKRLFDEVKQNEEKRQDELETLVDEKSQEPRIDVLNLPPRSEVHQASKFRTRIKVDKSLIRFVVVVLLFISGIGSVYYFWTEEIIDIIKNI